MAEVLVIEHRCDEPNGSFESLGGDRLIAMETEEPADRAGSSEPAYSFGTVQRQQEPFRACQKSAVSTLHRGLSP
jgi:hypothetical protein